MDRIHINGIRAYGYTGYIPEEQVLGQWFSVDLILDVDLTPSGQSDRLEQTYDYSSDVAAIQQLIQTAKYALIEKLAAEIAAIALQSPAVQQVQVRLTKERPPIPNFTGHVTLEITRRRP